MSGQQEALRERGAGLRCACGERIREGFEYSVFHRRLDPKTKEIVQTVLSVRTCGRDDCEVDAAMKTQAAARTRVTVEWPDDWESGELE